MVVHGMSVICGLCVCSSIKPVDKREGGGAHNWGRRDDGAVDDWPSEEPEAQLETQEPVANGEDLQEQK